MARTRDTAPDRALLTKECLIGQLSRRLGWSTPSPASTDGLEPPSKRRCAESVSEPLRVQDSYSSTVLYLAYGSNLCDETFLGKRKIKPLSAVNVQVPELRLTFDLPGIPYLEPCFADSGKRDQQHPTSLKQGDDKLVAEDSRSLLTQEYHKNRWKKGLLGTVYEVTKEDYAHIIATEGGGASYDDVLVECYPLSSNPTEQVPWTPQTTPFKAHTLFAPAQGGRARSSRRPDPSYAQASARYLKLITDGARERQLPLEYQKYLSEIRPYRITTARQRIGQTIFSAVWLPFVMFFFALSKRFQNDKGQAPTWIARLLEILFGAVWLSYDFFFKPIFGDGERTIEDDRAARCLPLTEKAGR